MQDKNAPTCPCGGRVSKVLETASGSTIFQCSTCEKLIWVKTEERRRAVRGSAVYKRCHQTVAFPQLHVMTIDKRPSKLNCLFVVQGWEDFGWKLDSRVGPPTPKAVLFQLR